MSKVVTFFKSPHILIALATGVSIIVLAFFSKRVLPEQIGYLPSSITPFTMVIFESLFQKYKDRAFMNVWYWVLLIFVLTAMIIFFNR